MSTWNGYVVLTQIDAMMSVAIFNDDAALFQEGIARLATRVPAYFYLESDGPTPVPIVGCEMLCTVEYMFLQPLVARLGRARLQECTAQSRGSIAFRSPQRWQGLGFSLMTVLLRLSGLVGW